MLHYLSKCIVENCITCQICLNVISNDIPLNKFKILTYSLNEIQKIGIIKKAFICEICLQSIVFQYDDTYLGQYIERYFPLKYKTIKNLKLETDFLIKEIPPRRIHTSLFYSVNIAKKHLPIFYFDNNPYNNIIKIVGTKISLASGRINHSLFCEVYLKKMDPDFF